MGVGNSIFGTRNKTNQQLSLLDNTPNYLVGWVIQKGKPVNIENLKKMKYCQGLVQFASIPFLNDFTSFSDAGINK